MVSVSLAHYLQKSVEPNQTGIALTNTILCLCNASKIIAKALCENGLPDNQLGIHVGDINSDGDSQKALDVLADKAIISSFTNARRGSCLPSVASGGSCVCHSIPQYSGGEDAPLQKIAPQS